MPPDDAQDNFTDPDSRIMKTSARFDQCYKGQIAVDEASQVIVATGLTDCNADNREMLPLIDQVEATLGTPPAEVLADAGYRGEATFQSLEARGITAYISLGHEVRPDKPPNPTHVATQRMAARLASDTGRARYRRRKVIAEPIVGWIKAAVGFRRFMPRGLTKARGEWTVICLAVNLKRLSRIGTAWRSERGTARPAAGDDSSGRPFTSATCIGRRRHHHVSAAQTPRRLRRPRAPPYTALRTGRKLD